MLCIWFVTVKKMKTSMRNASSQPMALSQPGLGLRKAPVLLGSGTHGCVPTSHLKLADGTRAAHG